MVCWWTSPSPPSRVSRQLTLTVGHASNARGDANTADTTAAPYHVWASPSNFDWEAPRRLRAAPIVVRYHVVWGHLASTLETPEQRERRHVNLSARDVWARSTLTGRLHVVCGPLQSSWAPRCLGTPRVNWGRRNNVSPVTSTRGLKRLGTTGDEYCGPS